MQIETNNENLLTKEEIEIIKTGVENNPQLRTPNVVTMMKCGRDCTTVYWVNSKKGLVWIKGNSDTGLQHIGERHYFSSRNQYWRKNQINKLDNPSRFKIGAYPSKHFDKISEDVFSPENKTNLKNTRPDLFDIYDGKSSYDSETEQDFRLVLYKDTLIIHSLFPLKGPKKINVNLNRCNSRGHLVNEENESLYVIGVPYRNQEGEAIYSLLFHFFLIAKNEVGYLRNHLNNSIINLYERNFESIGTLEEEIENINNADLSSIEKLMKKEMKKNKAPNG